MNWIHDSQTLRNLRPQEDESDDGLPLDLDADSIDTSEVDDTATQFLQLLQRLRQEQNASKTEEKETTETDRELPSNLIRMFTCADLDAIILAAEALHGFLSGQKIHYTKILRNTPII